MKRLDWTLIRPPRPSKKSLRLVDQIEERIALRLREARRRLLTASEVDKLADLEERLDNHTIAACEAARAPRVGDDPDWENRIVDEYADSDSDFELDEYLELRKDEFDCDRCPHAAMYSLYPQDPCEISVGPLLEAIADPELVKRISTPMGPDDMRSLADALDAVRAQGAFSPVPALDVVDLLASASRYLRFWGQLGFGIRPELLDEEEPIITPDGPSEPPDGETSSFLH